MLSLKEISQELNAPIKTFRLFAIEKALKASPTKELLEILESASRQETDIECQMLLEHAITRIKASIIKKSVSETNSPEKIIEGFPDLSAKSQLEAVSLLTAKDVKKDNILLSLVNSSKHSVVTSKLIKKFYYFWPEDKTNIWLDGLKAKSSALKISCLEALIDKSPSLLKPHFESLIVSQDPLFRALAIRGLAKNFPELAAELLHDFLLKGDYYGKMAALQACSVMKFSLGKASLLEFIFIESDEKLFKIAAAILLTNPDKEVPYRICEFLVKANKVKKVFFSSFLKKYMEIVKLSGICDDFEAYHKGLTDFIENLKARIFAANVLSLLENSSQTRRQELFFLISEKISIPNYKLAIERWISENPSFQFKEDIAALSGDENKEQLIAERKISEEEFSQMSDSLLLNHLVFSSKTSKKESQILISYCINDKNRSMAIKAAALRSAVRLEMQGFEKHANNWLNSGNEDLIASCFEYLAKFDRESCLLQLRSFITSKSPVIRNCLIKIVLEESQEDAKGLVTAMLKDSDVTVRKMGLSSVVNFEFSLIKEDLIDLLKTEENIELIDICLSFFQMNPMLESIYELALIKTTPGNAERIQQTIDAITENIKQLNIATEDEIKVFLQLKQSSVEVGASFNTDAKEVLLLGKLKGKIDWSSLKDSLPKVESKKILKNLFFAAVIIAVFVFFTGTEQAIEKSDPQYFEPVVAKIHNYEAVVQRLGFMNSGMLISEKKGKTLIVLPKPGEKFLLTPGDKILLRAIPFKRNADGILIVKTMHLQKIN